MGGNNREKRVLKYKHTLTAKERLELTRVTWDAKKREDWRNGKVEKKQSYCPF